MEETPSTTQNQNKKQRTPVDNGNIEPITADKELQCPTCFRYPAPIGSVSKLPPELEACFPLQAEGIGRDDGTKNKLSSRIQRDARIITSDEIREQIKVIENTVIINNLLCCSVLLYIAIACI